MGTNRTGPLAVHRPLSLYTGPSRCLQAPLAVHRPLSLSTGTSRCTQAPLAVHRPLSLSTGPSRCTQAPLAVQERVGESTAAYTDVVVLFSLPSKSKLLQQKSSAARRNTFTTK